MKRFSQLFSEIDRTNRTNEKVRALVNYFNEANPEDAAWALYFLTEKRLGRPVTGRQLLQWASESSGFDLWLLQECYDRVGDFAETVALLVNEGNDAIDLSLSLIVEELILPLREMEGSVKRNKIMDTWKRLGKTERLLYMKMITGGFRMGVARTLVIRALAESCGVDKAILSHRLMGAWQPDEDGFRRLVSEDTSDELGALPYPFYLAYPWEESSEDKLAVAEFRIEWKWDGIRCQLIKRRGKVALWSRGEELISEQFPELLLAAESLPDNLVLDGEIVAWSKGKVMPFGDLQSRLGRKRVGAALMQAVPVAFIAYDLLEFQAVDLRLEGLDNRARKLKGLIPFQNRGVRIFRVPELKVTNWGEVADWRDRAAEFGTEGVMIKRRSSSYGVGRKKGDWYKWKVNPFAIDAVLVYAQQGHGRRASLYTDYTFAVWDSDELVPVAKAYSGLTDKEICKVDAFIKKNTTGRKGPVRMVKPELVFELAFEGIRVSSRHRSGVAFRFPRISQFRTDKSSEEADTLEAVKALLPKSEKARHRLINQLELGLDNS